ncbi:hypothetical protein N500_0704 [Wolbachia pipientis wUni]|nr:hypothetical protein N500_0704 [Wolbachia pipientis wUni]
MQQSIQSMAERNAAIRLIKSYSEDGIGRGGKGKQTTEKDLM